MWLRGSFNSLQRAVFLGNFFHKAFNLPLKLKFGFEQHNPAPQTSFAPVPLPLPLRDEILLPGLSYCSREALAFHRDSQNFPVFHSLASNVADVSM